MQIYYRKLELIEDSIKKLSEIKRDNPDVEAYRKSWKDRDAAERNFQKAIEAIIDIGKMLIAEKRLKEPGNNREVFVILNENRLFPSELLTSIDKMIGMRNILVHSYDRIDDAITFGVLKKYLTDIRKLYNYFKKICIVK
jgi:uncharacterized protein YutE (UPF0331/DUF86 family)